MVFLCAVNYLTIEKKYENQLLAIFFAKMQQRRRTRSKCRKSRETAYYVLEKRRRFLFWQTGSSKTLLHIRKRLQKCIVVENWNEISDRSIEGQTLMLKGRDAPTIHQFELKSVFCVSFRRSSIKSGIIWTSS